MKHLSILFLCCCPAFLFAAPTSSPDRIFVDGISANTQVVVRGRAPLFSWDFTYDDNTRDQVTVEIAVGTAAGASDIWSDSRARFVSNAVYEGTTALAPDTAYFWQIKITDNNGDSSGFIQSTFHTIAAPVSLSSSKADLAIDWNNPFNPRLGQVTKIRYQLIDRNEQAQVRVYTITGELIKTLADHIALAGALYTVAWDGKNAAGEIVASGVYLVNLDAGNASRKTKRVVVLK